MKNIRFIAVVTLLYAMSVSVSTFAQTLLYEGSFTGTGTKAILGTTQVVSFPRVQAYARIYTDRIEVTSGGNYRVLNYWKTEYGSYSYGNEDYCWIFSPNPMMLSEGTREALIPMCRTCPTCGGGGYCGTCRGAGMVVNPYATTGTSLCGTCGGGGRCWQCNGNGFIM